MKPNKLYTAGLLAIAGAAAPHAFGQDTLILERAPFVTIGQFAIALIAGLLLAVGFQLVLTALTSAIGFSSLPNMVKKAEKAPYPIGMKNPDAADTHDKDKKDKDKEEEKHSSSPDHDPSFPIATMTSAFGVWTLVTASISLFFACWLATYLGLIIVPAAAVIIGLVIWATFFTLAAVLEVKSISTLVGSLTSAVTKGLKAGIGAVGHAMEKSPEQKIQAVADHTIDKVTHDIGRSFRENDFSSKISDYIDQLSPPEVDVHKIRQEIEDLISDIEVEENYTIEDEEAKRHLVLKIVNEEPRLSKKDKEKMKSFLSQAKDLKNQDGSPSEKAKAAVDKLSPGNEEDGRAWRKRFESYLEKTGSDELDPDTIYQDIDKIVSDPAQSQEVISNRLSQMDRGTAKSILSARDDIDEERAEQIVATVEKAVNRIKSQFGSSKEEANTLIAEGRDRGTQAKGKAESAASKAKGIPDKIRSRIESSIKSYCAKIDQPELSYDALSRDFERILDNPKETPEVLRERLNELDRDSLVALLAARDNVSQAKAERIADKVIESRDNLMKRLHKVELAAKEKYYQSRYVVLKELEHLRRSGAAAAWWLLGTAIVSGAAAAGGAMLGAGSL